MPNCPLEITSQFTTISVGNAHLLKVRQHWEWSLKNLVESGSYTLFSVRFWDDRWAWTFISQVCWAFLLWSHESHVLLIYKILQRQGMWIFVSLVISTYFTQFIFAFYFGSPCSVMNRSLSGLKVSFMSSAFLFMLTNVFPTWRLHKYYALLLVPFCVFTFYSWLFDSSGLCSGVRWNPNCFSKGVTDRPTVGCLWTSSFCPTDLKSYYHRAYL